MLSPYHLTKRRCTPEVGNLGWLSWHHLHLPLISWDPKQWPRGIVKRRGRPQSQKELLAGSPGSVASVAPHCAAQPPWEPGTAGAARWGGLLSPGVGSSPRCKQIWQWRGCDGCRAVVLPGGRGCEETRRWAEELLRLGGGKAKAAANESRRPGRASHC